MTNNISVLEELAKSKVKAKAAAKKMEIATLKKLIASLTAALKAEEKRIKEKEDRDRKNKIEKINQLLAESGLNVSDLKRSSGSSRKKATKKRGGKRGPVAPKYRLLVDGVEHLWSGRGRTPLVFAKHFDSGKSRKSVEIK